MKAARGVVWSILIYSIILAIFMIALTITSLTAYGCGFNFKQNSLFYMLYLIYFRAGRCHEHVNWSIFDGIANNSTNFTQPDMPSESGAVFRTLVFSVVYLVIGIFLVIACILSMAGLRRKGKSKHMIFWIYFMTFVIAFVSLIVIDLIASIFYLVDYFQTLSVNGLMRVLEIRNQDQIRPILEQVSFATRNMPSLIMFGATSKILIFLIINFFVITTYIRASWQVCKENEFMVVSSRTSISTVSTVAPTPALNVTVTTARAPETLSRMTQPPDARSPPASLSKGKRHAPPRPDEEQQPPYNPYMTNQGKTETNF